MKKLSNGKETRKSEKKKGSITIECEHGSLEAMGEWASRESKRRREAVT